MLVLILDINIISMGVLNIAIKEGRAVRKWTSNLRFAIRMGSNQVGIYGFTCLPFQEATKMLSLKENIDLTVGGGKSNIEQIKLFF